MFDLHLHLDGSLSIEDFKYLAKLAKIELPNDFPSCIYVPMDCKTLDEYLERFDLPLDLLQSEEAIEYLTCSLVKRLYALDYVYAEIRYAPLLHLRKGLTIDKVVEASIRGLKKGLENCRDFDANLILCCMRHADESLNLATVEAANKYRNDKICAVDLAGGETIHPSTYFKNVFDLAKKYNLNITIHAGEATGSQEIMDALDNGTMRIGHGVHLDHDNATLKNVLNHNTCFEFCPTSNLQTKSLLKYEDVPIMWFLDNKVPVTINSDNMTVSNTTAVEEMRHMMETFGFGRDIVESIYLNSIKYAFVSNEDRNKIKGIFDSKFPSFFNKYLNN